MGYAGPKAVSKVNMILKDKSCGLPSIKGLGNPLKKSLVGDQDQLPMHLQNAIKAAPGKKKHASSSGIYKKHKSGIYKKGCSYKKK
jgi:hypothetical protein